MFYFTTHSVHFIYGYMASDIIMVKDHSDSLRGNPLLPHGLLVMISKVQLEEVGDFRTHIIVSTLMNVLDP